MVRQFLNRTGYYYGRRMIRLFRSPPFITLTIVGNITIITFATIFYQLENGINPAIGSFLDACWWAFATVTTVGFGDIVPVTSKGKILGIFLMMGGTGLFASYTALFAHSLLGRDISQLDRDFMLMKENIDQTTSAIHREELQLFETIGKIRNSLDQIETGLQKKTEDS